MRAAASLAAIVFVVRYSRVEGLRLDRQDAPFYLLTNLRKFGPVQPNISSAYLSWALPSGVGDQESFGLYLADSVTGKILLEQNGTSAAPSTDLVISGGLLRDMHAYKWRVSACMTRGECLAWSDWAFFTTGWAGEPAATTATPMWMEGADGFVLFRREIEASFRQDVVLALAAITANPQTTHGSGIQNAKLLASYKLYLDGALAGMGPGRVSTCGPVCPIQDATTECSCEPHHLYDVYDVTALVTQGPGAGRQGPEYAQMKVSGQSVEKGDGALGPWGTEGQAGGGLEDSGDRGDSASSTMVVALQTYMSRNYGEDGPVPPKVLMQLDLVLRNGSRISIGSGPSFKAYNATDYFNPSCCASAYKQDQYQPHDNFDARQEPVGWRQAGFNDSAWEQAVPSPGWWAPLRPRPSNNVLVTHGLQPQDIRQYPSSHTLDLFVDFGLEFMGGLDVSVDAPPGSEGIVLDVSMTEDLLPGTAWPRDLKVPMHTGNDYHEQWTLREGPQRFTQHEYSEFRFARIRVLPPGLNASQQGPPPASSFNISAWRVRYDADYTGTEFEAESDNATLAQAVTRVHGLSRDTQVTTTIDMFTDSNTRQRDVMCGENININSRMGWASSLEFMVQRQSLEYGIQQRGWGGPGAAEWPMIMVISTYQDYMRTGLLDIAERHYATLRNWTGTALVNYSSGLWSCPPCGGLSRVEHCTANVTLFNCNGPEIDWPSNLRDGFVYRPENTVVNAFSYRALVSFEALARALNRSQDADRAAAAASRMRSAAQTLLLPDPAREGVAGQQLADGFIDGAGTSHQAWHSTVFAMLHGLADGLEEEQLAALRGMVLRRMEEQDGIVGGVYLGPWALTVLFQNVTDHGHAGVRFMAAAGPHSWLHQLSLNATAGMEAWDPSEKPNLTFSHPWGAPLVWVVAEYLMGVRATAPGFATFEVRPQLGALTRASLVVPSIRGPIPVDVNQTLQQEMGEQGRTTIGASGLAPAGFSVRVEVPGSCRAVVYAPVPGSGSDPRVEVDGRRLGEMEVELEQPHEQYAVVPLEPGVHVIRTGAHVTVPA